MRINEAEFKREDPEHKGYSLLEVDYYASINTQNNSENHRLSLRKNLTNGKFEAYRHYENGREELITEGNLRQVALYCEAETEKYHGYTPKDQIIME